MHGIEILYILFGIVKQILSFAIDRIQVNVYHHAT